MGQNFQERLGNPKTYIDMVKVYEKVRSYTDWEGFSDPEPVLKAVDNALLQRDYDRQENSETFDVARQLVLHYVFNSVDQADYEMTEEDILNTYDIISYILSSRWWLRSDAE